MIARNIFLPLLWDGGIKYPTEILGYHYDEAPGLHRESFGQRHMNSSSAKVAKRRRSFPSVTFEATNLRCLRSTIFRWGVWVLSIFKEAADSWDSRSSGLSSYKIFGSLTGRGKGNFALPLYKSERLGVALRSGPRCSGVSIPSNQLLDLKSLRNQSSFKLGTGKKVKVWDGLTPARRKLRAFITIEENVRT